MSKGRGQTKCYPWSSRLGFACGANKPNPEKKPIVTNSPDPMVEVHGEGQDPNRVPAPVKKKFSFIIVGVYWGLLYGFRE
jgi:hypothetical protein